MRSLFVRARPHFKNLRYRLWRQSAQLVSKSFCDFPTGVVENERTFLHLEARDHLESMEVLGPPAVVSVTPLALAFPDTLAFGERLGYILRKAVVDPQTGAVCVGHRRLLGASVGNMWRVVGWGRLIPSLNAPVTSNVEEGLAVAMPPLAYYHWLTETVPALLFALERGEQVAVVTTLEPLAYVLEMVEILQSAFPEKVECHRTDDRVRCGRLFFLTRPLEVTHPHPADVAALQRLATVTGVSTAKETRRRIYVSRRHAPRRAYKDEVALEDLLRRRRFEIVHLERMPLAEQMATMCEAEVVVGFHGAGLTNVVWSNRGARVVEVFLKEAFTDYYRNLAGIAGHRYGSLSAVGVTPEQLADSILGLVDNLATTP